MSYKNDPQRTTWVNSVTPELFYGRPRNIYAPAAVYGNMPGASVADLGRSEAQAIFILHNLDSTSGSVTSNVFTPGGNGIDVVTTFTDQSMRCSIDVINNADSSVLVTFNNISNLTDNLPVNYVSNNIILNGRSLTLRVYNITGSGTVTVGYRIQ